jgi:hypothetical protein
VPPFCRNDFDKQIVLREDAEMGRRYGLSYVEPFHDIGPKPSMLEEYSKQHAVPV